MNFSLSINDFTLREKKVEVLKSWVDPDFLREQMAAGNVRPPRKEPIVRRRIAAWVFHGHSVEVSFDPTGVDEREAVEGINAFLSGLDSGLGAIRGAVSDWLLETYNSEWAEDRRRLSREEFLKALGPLKNIEYSKSRTTLYWDDNGLFDRHLIEVRMKNNKVTEVLLGG